MYTTRLIKHAHYILLILFIPAIIFAEEDKDGLITKKELTALDKFREIIGNELYLDYMKTDEFLVRWIRDQHFDLEAAATKLRKSLKWRKENNIDNILKEDFSDIQRHCPFTIDGHDVDLRPVLTFSLGQCDIRRLSLTGNLPRLHRTIWYVFESGAKMVRELRAKYGIQIHRVVIIADAGGFDLRRHACLRCLSLVQTLLETNESHYPASLRHIYIVNIPRGVQPLVELFLPAVSKLSLDQAKLFGYDKKEWSQEILKTIEPDQISAQFGGTKRSSPK